MHRQDWTRKQVYRHLHMVTIMSNMLLLSPHTKMKTPREVCWREDHTCHWLKMSLKLLAFIFSCISGIHCLVVCGFSDCRTPSSISYYMSWKTQPWAMTETMPPIHRAPLGTLITAIAFCFHFEKAKRKNKLCLPSSQQAMAVLGG